MADEPNEGLFDTSDADGLPAPTLQLYTGHGDGTEAWVDNRHDGLMTSSSEGYRAIPWDSVGRNNPRPVETEGVNKTHLFGTFSD